MKKATKGFIIRKLRMVYLYQTGAFPRKLFKMVFSMASLLRYGNPGTRFRHIEAGGWTVSILQKRLGGRFLKRFGRVQFFAFKGLQSQRDPCVAEL
jgi:hypothetical protein